MVQELNVRINAADEYNLNAEGKDYLNLENILSTNIVSKSIVDGKLVIETSNNKKIRLSNFDGLSMIKTSDMANPESLILDGVVGKNPVTDPISPYYYAGTGRADDIDATNGGTPESVSYVKVKKKWVPVTTPAQGVTIDAGNGDDIIRGSRYDDIINAGEGNNEIYVTAGNDTHTGGSGTNIYYIDTESDFGTNTLYLTEGETIKFQLQASTGTTNIHNLVIDPTFGNDLIVYVYKEPVTEFDNLGFAITDGLTLAGTVIMKDYFITKNVTIKGYNNLGMAPENELTDGVNGVQAIITNMYQQQYLNLLNTYDAYQAGESYHGTSAADTINASGTAQQHYTNWYKVKKRWYSEEIYTQNGVTINSGEGADNITGSNYKDTIYGGDGADIIDGGDGNDTIYGGDGGDRLNGQGGDDYIEGGAGSNELIFSGNFGNDTVKLTDGENVVLNLSAYGTKAQLASKIAYTTDGDNLRLTITDGGEVKGTITLLDYARTNVVGTGSVTVQGSDSGTVLSTLNVTPASSGSYSTVGSRFAENVIDAHDGGTPETVSYVKVKKKWVPVYNPAQGVTITGGDKNDEITGSKYNDAIVGGKGTNTVNLKTAEAFGTDTYYMTEGENLVLKLDGVADVTKELSGNDLIVTVAGKGQVIVKDFVTNATGTAIIEYADATPDFDLTSLISGKTINYGANETYTAIGSIKDDTIDASLGGRDAYSYSYKVKKKWYTTNVAAQGVTINAGAGNDTITGSKHNDIITGGSGTNIVKLSIDNTFGEDSYYMTQGENLKIKLVGSTDNSGDYSTKVEGTDLVVTVYNKNKTAEDAQVMGKLYIKNFAVEDLATSIQLYGKTDDVEGVGIDIKTPATTTEAVTLGGGSYTGTRLNDTIDASGAVQVMNPRTYKYKKKWYTVYDVPTGRGVDVDGGAGDDTITGSNYNDTLKGGSGVDTILGGLGNDYIEGGSGADILSGNDGDDTIYGGADGDTITGGKGNDFIYGGTGANTLVFNNGDGRDVVYSDGGTDTLYFADVADLSKLILASDGTNLLIKYSDNGIVILDKYFTEQNHSVKKLMNNSGSQNPNLTDFIDTYNTNGGNTREFAIIGEGIIEGTSGNNEIIGSDSVDIIDAKAGNDIIYGGRGNDTITAGEGINKIVYNGMDNFGTDTIVLTPSENLTIDVSALNLTRVDYSYSGNDLLITTEKGNIVLKDFAVSDVTKQDNEHQGAVLFKLSDGVSGTIDLRGKTYDIAVGGDYTGTWHNENIDAHTAGDRIEYRSYKIGKRWYTDIIHTGDGVTIRGGAGNDTITGSDYRDTLFGGEDTDTIYGGKGNDTIYGNAGSDEILGGEGDDVIYADEHPDTVLPDGYANGTNTVYGDEGNDTIYGGAGNDTITGGTGDDIIRGGKGNNTIIYNTNNDGSDTIYSSGGTDTLQFNNDLNSINDLTFARWGRNLIIKYSDSGRITVNNYFLDEDHNYDIDENHSVKNVKIGEVTTSIETYFEEYPERLAITGEGLIKGADNKNDFILGSNVDDVIYGLKGNDTIDAGLGNNTIIYRQGDGQDIIKNGGGNDTFVVQGFEIGHDFGFMLGDGEDNNLYISSSNQENDRMITIENFKTGDYSLKYVQSNDEDFHEPIAINNFLYDKYGTNGDDIIESVYDDHEEIYHLNKGNDTVVFGERFHENTIYSTQEIDDIGIINTDTLLFNNHSISADNLDVSYNRNNVGVSDGVMIVARDNQTNNEAGKVAYQGLILNGEDAHDDTPNLVIKDSANRTWDVKSYNQTSNIDWSQDNGNHVAFIQGVSGTNTVVSNSGHNIINTSSGIGANGEIGDQNGDGADVGASLNYTYKGGHDRVRTESISDDTYNVEEFTANTALSIKDAGGDDRYEIGTNAANIRFLFNVTDPLRAGEFQADDDAWNHASLFMIHKDKYNTQTIMDYVLGTEEKSYSEGIVTIKLQSGDEDAVFNVAEDIKHMHTADFTDDIDLTKWFEGIDARVLAWLRDNNFASTIHALTACAENNQTDKIEELLNIYRGATYESVVLGGTDEADTIVGSIGHDHIYGQGGNDTITGAEGNDEITGGTGTNTLIFKEQNFGNDTVNLTETENLILDLTALNLTANQISYTRSGSDLVITTPNGTIRLNNFVSTDVTGETGSVNLKLSNNPQTGTVDLRAKLYDLPVERNVDGTWLNEKIDASEVDQVMGPRSYKSGKRWYTAYDVPTGVGATINGMGGDDDITGSAWKDEIRGGEGNDTINAGANDDYIEGNEGNDSINGGTGADTIYGNAGNDEIHGGEGNDVIYADEHPDTVLPQGYVNGTNTVYGDAGEDIIYAGKGNDTIYGGDDNDTIYGNEGTNEITGGKGNDIIYTQSANNNIHVGTDDGNDTIHAGTGTNTIIFDNLDVENAAELKNALTLAYNGTTHNFVIKYSDNGTINLPNYEYDTQPEHDFVLKAGDFEVSLYNFISNTYGTANISITGSGIIDGTEGNDTIIGSDGADIINGRGGNDKIYGEGGNDIIHAEGGASIVHGGAGNDEIHGGGTGAELYGDAGDDTIYATASYTLINGGIGNDTIHAEDYYNNTIVLNSDCGNDTIFCNTLTTIKFADIANLEGLPDNITIAKKNDDYIVTYGSNAITLKNVNQFGLNFQTADSQEVLLNNYLQDHPLVSVITGSGTVVGTSNADTIYADTSSGWWYNDVYGYGGNDTIYGSSIDDMIDAGKGDDKIYGGAGNDDIYGGEGDDIINGGTGRNTIHFSAGDGDDVVENGGGYDTLQFNADIQNRGMRRIGNDLEITYGNDDTVTVVDYYLGNHSVKSIISSDYRTYTVDEAFAKWGNAAGGEIVPTGHTSKHAGVEQDVILAPNGNQTITATSQTNQIFGGDGNDTITGGSERDDIYGGDGDDYIRGGAGADHLWGGSGANTFEFRSGDGADIIYEFGADNTLYFPDVVSFNDLNIETSAGSLLSGWHGRNWTQQIMTISGYGNDNDSVNMYNSGYENYKIKIKNGTTISLAQFIRVYHPEVTQFVTENLGANEGSSFGGTQYVPTNLVPELKPAGYIVNGSADATVYSGGSISGYGSPSITGGAGNDTIFAGINAQGEKEFYFKSSPYADAQPLEGYNDWGYARLCYKVERDAQGNPVSDGTTNADGSQNVQMTTEVKVGGYFYAYTASIEYNDVEHNPNSEDWWDDITLTQDELRTYYKQYLGQKATGNTVAMYEEPIDWNDNTEGSQDGTIAPKSEYYDSFTQYKSFSGPGTYEVKVNYYKPTDVNEEFTTGLLTEKFTTTYNDRAVTMVISKQQVGANHYGQAYAAYGYGLSADNVSVDGGAGNDTIYTSNTASGGEGDDTIYTQGSANGDEGNDKLVAFHDEHDGYYGSQNFDGGAGYDMIDLSQTQMSTEENEYNGINVSMSEGVDTVFFNKDNPNAQYYINASWYRPDPNARAIETRYAGYDNYQSGYLRMGDDYVLMNHNQYGGSAIVLKDYYKETLDSIRNNIAISVPTMYSVSRYPEYPEFSERYGMLGLQPDTNNGLPYLDQWLGVSATDGDKLHLNAVDHFDNAGQQYAGSFTIFTKDGQKYTTHTAAFDEGGNEKAVNFLSNGNALYKTLVKYNHNELTDQNEPEYVTKTILNKTVDDVTSYYVEDWTMDYTLPYFNENISVAMDVQYGTDRNETRAAQYNGYYNQKGVVYTFDRVDVRQYNIGGQTDKWVGKDYNQISVYEEEDGRKYTLSYVDGHYKTDNEGNYVLDEQGNNIYVDGDYEKHYLETDNNGDFVLQVKVGTYSHRGEQGEFLDEDIMATITIHRNILTKDGEGNIQFTANIGDGENVTPVTYTIKKDAELALRTDEDGYVWYKKIIGQNADGNNETVEVKIGKVNAQGIFTELYGDTDLFNQKTYYEREDVKAALANRYLTWKYQQNDFLIGGNGSQTIKAGDGDDTIYGANIPAYDNEGNLAIDNSGDNLYGEDGADYIVGGSGNDFIDGGEGSDYILAGDGDDTIVGGRGIKYTRSAGAYDNVELEGDVIYGEGGNDTIYSVGKYDNEENFDANGSKTYLGKYAHDLEGSDHVYQKNKIYAGDGDDTIIVNGWSDTVDAGAGDDTIDLYAKYDPMYYKEGDPLYANQNEYVIDGGDGDDTINLHGEMFAGEVNGGSGDDVIDARELEKSELPDIRWNSTPSGVNINGGAGNDLIHGSSGNDQLTGGDGDDTVYGYAGNDDISVGQELYYRGTSYAYGGEGDDTLRGGGASKLFGEAGNDKFYFATGQTGKVIVPTTLTMDGGSGDDTYIEGDGYTVGYGYDTIIASSGNDKIIFNNASSNSFTMYRNGDDLCIKHLSDYAIVGGGTGFENILILKDYYNESNKVYGDEHNKSAKELFDNYMVVLQNGNVTRGNYKLSKFIDYTTGVININTNGVGTDADDFIEARKTIDDINGKGGNDNIIAGEKTTTISGGSGGDTISGTDGKDVQFITGDNGKVTGVAKEYQAWNSETGQYEYANYKVNDNYYETGFVNYTYTPGDSSNDGNDNITLYADKNYVWGEGGDDTINIVGDSSYNFIWGGDGNDTIHNLPTYYSQGSSAVYDGGSGNDTIIGNAEWIDGGSGDDVLKVKNHTGMNYENRLRMLVDLYNKKGVNTDEALEIRQAILDAGAAIRSAVQNKTSAQSNLDSDYYGYPQLARLQQYRDNDAEQVAEYQQRVDQLDPDYVDSLTDYYRNELAEAKASLAQHEASIATRQAYIDEKEAAIVAADATIAEKQALIAEKIAELKTKGYDEFVNSYSIGSGTSLVFGGDGDDEITLGFDEDYIDEANEVDEPAYQGAVNGSYYVRGGAGDDTYIIPDYYYEDEKTGEVTHDFNLSAKIEDTQGHNTLVLQSQDLDSAGVGILMNVELDKDENGNYVTDEHGNYSYHFKNFQTRISDSDRAPLGGGDMEYCIVITDSKTYAEGHSDYYGGLYKSGLRFSYETLQTFDRIQASDGKYINIAQINKAAQNVANWLGEHDYPDYQYAVGLEDYVDWNQSNVNKTELLGIKGFGSIEWLDDSDPATVGVTEGTEGTYLSDKLTSTGEDETFNLSTGNDTVTFTGEFGNDVIISETLTDVDGNAVQADTLNFKDYSIKDGTLKVEVDPDDANSIKFTAYGEDGSVKGTVIYQDVINSNYSSRKIYINDADGENQLIVEDSYKAAKAQNSSNTQLSVDNDNVGASPIYITNSSGEISLRVNGNMNYNYVQADENTTLAYFGDYKSYRDNNKDYYTSAAADVVTSLGETDDQYTIRFTDNTNATITDMGGSDTLYLYYGSTSWKQSQEIRLFFDVDYTGKVSDSLNIVHADKLLTEDAQNVANLLKGEHTMTGVITINGEIESIETRDKTSQWSTNENNINVTKWKEKITENIKNWLVMNGYKDVGSALATGNKAVISAVLNFYNMTYADATGKGNTSVNILSDKASMDVALISGTQGNDVVNIPDNLEKDLIVNTFAGSDSVTGTVDGAVINTGIGNDAVDITGKNNHITGGAGNDSMKVTAGENDTNYFYFTTGDGKDTISGTGKMVLTFNNTAITPDTSDYSNADKYFMLERRDNDLTIKYSSESDNDSVTIENYYNNVNSYTMIDKYGVEMLVKDFVTSYLAAGKEVVEQNNTTFTYTDDTDRVIIPTGATGYTYNLGNGADTITGENITGVTINGGSGEDVITISGTGNTINPGAGNDRITITGVGENATNTVVYSQSNHINLLSASNSEIKIKLDFAVNNLSLHRSGDHLIIKHNAGQNGFVITDYFNNEVVNANYKIVDSNNTETVLATFVNNYGNITELNNFIPEFSNDNVINTTQNYDVVGTEGSETILVTEKNTKIDLAGGNDTVNISNTAGGNIITIPYGDYKYDSSSLHDNTATLNFNDTNVNFSVSGNDLLISSEDLSDSITIKDFVVQTDKNQPNLIVKDKEKTYQVNAGYGISGNSQYYAENLYWNNDTYNHVAIYNGTFEGNDLYVYANEKENIVNVSGGMQANIYYRKAGGLLTVNDTSTVDTGVYIGNTYEIEDFSTSSGILINDAGGNDELYFRSSKNKENNMRLFFDVKKVNDNYVADMKTKDNDAYTLIMVHRDAFDADNLLAALGENWKPEHTGIIKFDCFGDSARDAIHMNQSYDKTDIDNWVSTITTKVRAWLTDANHRYDSVTLALQNATPEQKAELLALYDYRIDNHYYDLTEGNDTTLDETANDDTVEMKVGVNNLTFGENFGHDKLGFKDYYGTYDDNRIDNLNFTEFGFEDGTLSVARGRDNENNINKEIIFTAQDGSTVTYNAYYNNNGTYGSSNVFTNDDIQVNITDKNRTYSTLIRYKDYNNEEHDWTSDSEKDKNHLAILKGNHAEGYNNHFFDITSNDEHNIIVTEGGARLVYTFNGGNDIVNSMAENANDMYKINTFTATSSLTINDRDEQLDTDVVVFSADALNNARIFFDVSATDQMPDFDSLIFMHKDVASNLTGDWSNVTAGVISMDGIELEGVDTVKDENRENINVGTWADRIKEEVVGFLTDKGFADTGKVFTEGTEDDVAELIAMYNKSYTDVMNQQV